MVMITRRSVLIGLLAAPIVVREGLCMPVRKLIVPEKTVTELFAEWQNSIRLIKSPTHVIVQQRYVDAARKLISQTHGVTL